MENFKEFKARYLNPLTDFGFHKIFGTEANKGLLIDFLNEVIRGESVIIDIEYFRSEQWGFVETNRKAVFDIFCKTKNGESFIVEMQKAKQAYFRDRSIFYASLPILNQAVKGIWDFRLKAVYLVAILDFLIFEEFEDDRKYVVEHVSLMRERTKTVFSDKLKFAFVELPKFNKKEKELVAHFDKWLYLLRNLPKLKSRPESVGGKIFDELFDLADIKRLTKEDMETYKSSVLEYYDVQSAMMCAREEGREEGIQKGILKGRKEGIRKGIEKGILKGIENEKIATIQKCLQKNIAIDDIVFLTGYSKEQIMKLGISN